MLSKTEIVWRHLLIGALDEERRRTSITALSHELGLATTTIHGALERPRSIGAVLGNANGLRIVDPKRLLHLWAGTRDLARDIVYSTHVTTSAAGIEARLPLSAIPTAFTAYVRHEGRNVVADYDQVVVYGYPTDLRRRFSAARGQANLIVLELDPLLPRYGAIAPRCQVYVDLFNLPGWQAQRFLEALERRLLADVA
jgi:hypothetical protein